MRRISLLLILLCFTGCAISRQTFIDRSYEEGLIVREVEGHSTTIAPPFGARAGSQHTLRMDEAAEGWTIDMGGAAELFGGEVDIPIELLPVP